MSHPQDTEVDHAAAELHKQMRRSLLIARRVMLSRHTRRLAAGAAKVAARPVAGAAKGLARPVAGAAKSAVREVAVRWPVAAAAAGWAAAHAAREAAGARWQQAVTAAASAVGGVPDAAREQVAHLRRVMDEATRAAQAWDERITEAGVDPDQVREQVHQQMDHEGDPAPGPVDEQQPTPEADVGAELVTEFLAEEYTAHALDHLDEATAALPGGRGPASAARLIAAAHPDGPSAAVSPSPAPAPVPPGVDIGPGLDVGTGRSPEQEMGL